MSLFRLRLKPGRKRIKPISTRYMSTFDALIHLDVEADISSQLTIPEALNSHINKSMEMNSGGSLKASVVQNIIVKSWEVGKGVLTGLKEILLGNNFPTRVESPATLKIHAPYGICPGEISDCLWPVDCNGKKMKLDSGLSSISSNLTHRMVSNMSIVFLNSKAENEVPESADAKDKTDCTDGFLPSPDFDFSDKSDQVSSEGLLKKSDDKGKKASSRDQGMNRDCNRVTRPNAMPMSRVLPSRKGVNVSPHISVKKYNDKPVSQLINTDQYKVLVRFLPKSANYGDIKNGLKVCGPVVNVRELPSIPGSKFKDAYVSFETLDGMRKALEKLDVTVKHSDLIVEVVVEGSFPFESLSRKLPIPNIIGNLDAPFSLVKNPTRTVTVQRISPDITLGHLREAFVSRGSGISTCFFGPSSSVAYVEFESEAGKEKTIAEHWINVLGKQLVVHRLDAPRTTVVRLSNLKLHPTKAVCICEPLGQIKHVISRSSHIVDVHFMVTEWPNMLHILNKLNGMAVEGEQLVAMPAPCFPPKIIHALWNHPDERKHLKGIIGGLAHQLNQKSVSTGTLKNLIAKCYRDDGV